MNPNQESMTPAEAPHLDYERWVEVSAEWGVLDEDWRDFLLEEVDLSSAELRATQAHWMTLLVSEARTDATRAKAYGRRCAEVVQAGPASIVARLTKLRDADLCDSPTELVVEARTATEPQSKATQSSPSVETFATRSPAPAEVPSYLREMSPRREAQLRGSNANETLPMTAPAQPKPLPFQPGVYRPPPQHGPVSPRRTDDPDQTRPPTAPAETTLPFQKRRPKTRP